MPPSVPASVGVSNLGKNYAELSSLSSSFSFFPSSAGPNSPALFYSQSETGDKHIAGVDQIPGPWGKRADIIRHMITAEPKERLMLAREELNRP